MKAGPLGYIATGSDECNATAWISEDEGLTWRLIEGPRGSLNVTADYAPFAIDRFGDRILVVGQCGDCSGVWISNPDD